ERAVVVEDERAPARAGAGDGDLLRDVIGIRLTHRLGRSRGLGASRDHGRRQQRGGYELRESHGKLLAGEGVRGVIDRRTPFVESPISLAAVTPCRHWSVGDAT